jgi:hypothetical protein
MTLDAIMRDIEAMREDLLMFERKYGMPTEVFYEAYHQGEEPAEPSWVLDWSEWVGTYKILQDRLKRAAGLELLPNWLALVAPSCRPGGQCAAHPQYPHARPRPRAPGLAA